MILRSEKEKNTKSIQAATAKAIKVGMCSREEEAREEKEQGEGLEVQPLEQGSLTPRPKR